MQSTDCPVCGHANPAGAKFCNECGSPLHLTLCKRCDAVNHVNDVRCYRCGASLAARQFVPEPAGNVRETQPVGLDQQAEWVEQELHRFEHEAGEAAQASSGISRDQRDDAPESGPDEHDLGTLDTTPPEVDPHWRGATQPQAGSFAQADTFTYFSGVDKENAARFWQSSEMRLPEARKLFSEIAGRPRSRWPEYLGGLFAGLVVLVMLAGGYLYYARNLSPDRAEQGRGERSDVRSSLVPTDRGVTKASKSVPPEPPSAAAMVSSNVMLGAAAPASEQSDGPPTERRDAAPATTGGENGPLAGSAPDATAAAAEPQCPPAVVALALCDRIARADHK
jgi:Double zinc ribbon